MVKIAELNDKQLVAQIAKYDRILSGLLKERKKRIKAGTKPSSLMTPNEREVANKMKSKGKLNEELYQETSSHQLEQEEPAEKEGSQTPSGFDLENVDLAQAQQNASDEEEEEEEEVRVTKLLQLNQEQMEELKQAAAKNNKKDKKKKKGLFG